VAKNAAAGAVPYYTAHLCFDPESEADKIVRSAIASVAKTAFGTENNAAGVPMWQARLEKLKENASKVCYSTKPKTDGTGAVWAGFDGKHWVRASNKNQPTLINRDKSPITEQMGLLYPSVIVNARVDIWIPKDGSAINATLFGVQYVEEGANATRYVRRASADDFPDLSGDSDSASNATDSASNATDDEADSIEF